MAAEVHADDIAGIGERARQPSKRRRLFALEKPWADDDGRIPPDLLVVVKRDLDAIRGRDVVLRTLHFRYGLFGGTSLPVNRA